MAALRIAVAWCAVAAAVSLSGVAGGAGWNVPRIPAGRRAQYYLQKDNGGYLFGYDTGEGHSAQAAADAANEVQGAYAYVGADGRAIGVRYSAGQGGYVPQVDGVQVADVPAPASSYARAGAGAGAGVVVSSSDANQQDADYDANADASYSFNIDTDSYKRSEQADARGNVRGQYSYSSAQGGSHALSYAAGEGTGFVVTGAAASPSAPAPASSYSGAAAASTAQGASNVDGSYSFSFGTDEQSRQESSDAQNNVRGSYSFRAKDDGKLRRVDYSAGAATGFIARGDHLPVAPEVPAIPSVYSAASPAFPAAPVAPAAVPAYSGPLADIQNTAGGDGSYSFAFGTDLQSRQEAADAQNNVRGSYSFRAKDDGKLRRVDYEAGAATGFVAKGDHLPVAPSVPVSGSPSIPSARYPVPAPAPAPIVPYSGPISNAEGASNVDGSYSFSYKTNDQSRQESADAQNNVRGSYSFRAKDDGKTRRVDYVAGAGTGFVASGDHLPVAPETPTVGGVTVSSYAAPAVPAVPVFPAPTVAYAGTAAAQGSSGVDGSYTFSYNTNDQSRQESSDSQNNVRGSFSFTAPDDGQTRRVDYEAGSATGFVAKGAHLPVAPAVPAVPAVSVYSAPSVPAIPAVPAFPAISSAPATPYSGPTSNAEGSANADGSYSFSYSSNDQSRQESSDANNNVRGSYSFRAKDDGKTRRVDYVAGAGTGFVASGDHLPVAPEAPAVPSSRLPSPAAASSASASADGSYSFAYDAADHSRQEAADAAGNVRGSFSFVAKDDGQARRVDYSAGAATGFLATGAHLPAAGAPGAAGASPIATSYSSSSGAASGADGAGDASYSYSYQTDSSSKSESADARGNVRGEYSYTAGDGATRRVSYTSRDNEGFVASGDVGAAGAAGIAGAAGSTSSVVAARTGAGSGRSYAATSSSSSGHHGGITVRTGGAVINQYLPPESSQKFGYIYDTKA